MSEFCIKATGLYYKDNFVSEFWPEINAIQHLISPAGQRVQKLYIVSIRLMDGRTLSPRSFSSISAIPYFELWQECKDALLTAQQKKLLYSYLQEQAADLQATTVYLLQRLGLYEQGFLFGRKQMISVDGQNACDAFFAPELPDFPFTEIKDGDLIAYSDRLLALKPGVSDILFSVSLLSVLKPLFSHIGYPPNFFISIYGQSGCMKTTLAELFFAQTPAQKLSFTSSSKKEIERALNLFQGHTIVIDDYHPALSTYDKQKLASRMDMIARSSDKPDHALAVVTGEFLDGGFSVQDRMIQIHIDTPVEALTELSDLQKDPSLLTSLLYRFAEAIYSRQKEVSSTIREWFETMPHPIRDRPTPSYRIERNIHYLALSLELFFQHFSGGAILREKWETIGTNSLCRLKNQQRSQMERLRLIEDGSDWLEILYELLQSDLWERYNAFPSKLDDSMHLISKDGYIYINSPIFKRAFKKFLGRMVNMKPLINAMIEAGILKEDKSNAHVVKRNGLYYYAINELQLEVYHHQFKDS